MKQLLIICIISNSVFAMQQPYSKKNCFFAYSKFKALTKTYMWNGATRGYPVAYITENIEKFHKKFLDECIKEANIKNPS